ncbi:hypothetical protein [Parasphingopyxis lamellibrachiae]|uniref:Uncharacterized protein n=1 Tax=Parasphingopyxis lamellibrachiae TaxID=680125 RepID=A0A3D9FF32_9SPHN|nr:hypothetical protein [Parasphingopyxis lamellibrachiae]RED16424.1 hypothetical protein DFR46_1447 [Parasphingopyxis lamellibrachiae]
MVENSANDSPDPRQERINRIRIGATGLATIVLIVLLAATFSGTASNEPELTPEGMAEQAQDDSAAVAIDEQPQEPLAELGVAPGPGPAEDQAAEPATEPPAADSPEN